MDIVSAIFGKKKTEGEVELDTGEGLDELTEEEKASLRLALGDDYDKIYGNK